MTTTNDKSTATAIHLSALTQYCIPFGNFIFPVLLWSTLKGKSEYINSQGKQSINFQLSLFLYTILLAVIAVPIFIINVLKGIEFSEMHRNSDFFVQNFDPGNVSTIVVVGIIAVLSFIFLKVIEFFLIIYAALKTSNGENYKYPMTISFLK